MKDDYKRAEKLGADYYVLHPGNHTGAGIVKGIENIIKGLDRIMEKVKDNTVILLENVAGAGTSVGSNFRELYDIIKGVSNDKKLGVCVDTCHAFSAGYDLREKNELERLLSDIENTFGINMLKLIHINDSKYKVATNKDEHAHIGEGKIGKEGFKNIVNHPLLKDLPFILETPQFDGEDEDVKIIKKLRTV